MTEKLVFNTSSVVSLDYFSVFSEYFISTSAIYILIICSLITYNTYNLIVQKALSNCIALILLMSCYLLLNDDCLTLNFLNFHNSIISDQLSFFTKFIICLFSAIYFFFIAGTLKEQNLVSFEYLVVVLLAVLGLITLCSSQDLLTAYLSIELISLSSYILASFKKTSSYSIEAGLKYFVTGAISSALFLLGSSFIYFFSGSLNIQDLQDLFADSLFSPNSSEIWQYYNIYENPINQEGASLEYHIQLFEILQQLNLPYLIEEMCQQYNFMLSYDVEASIVAHFNFLEYGLTLILFSLFIKLALAPFHLWSLDVYEGSPTPSSFFFAALAKLSIFVFLLRFCYIAFPELNHCWQFYSVCVGVLSVFVGSFGGLKQKKIKTLLAYSSTSHMGYALLAFSTAHSFGVQMLLFYLTIYMLSGLSTWFIFLLLRLKRKSTFQKHSKELGDFVLLRKANSMLALALSITMFSVAGIPPLVGFFAKMGVFLAVVKNGNFSIEFYSVALVSVLCSVISTFYYIRIVKVLYFENMVVGKLYYPINTYSTVLLGFLVFLLLFLFINPTLLYLVTYKVGFLFCPLISNL